MFSLAAFRWHFKRVILAANWPLPAAVAAAALAAALWQADAQTRKKTQALDAEISGLQMRAELPSEKARTETLLQAFTQKFPQREEARTATLERIFAAAQSAGLVLGEGEYREDEAASALFSRYVVALPVQGDYPQVHKFVARVLKEEPAVSLASISFSRPRISDAALEAHPVFVIHSRRK